MPATSDEPSDKSFRSAVLTIWDLTWDQQLPEKLTFIAFGREICPTTGTPHFQAFAYAQVAMRLTGWNKVFKHLSPHTYVHKMDGSFVRNEAYCSKEGSYTKIGEEPMANGNKRSLMQVKEAIDAGHLLEDIVQEDSHFAAVIQNKNALQWYEQIKLGAKRKAEGFKPPEVHVIIGPAGCGKTREVYDKEGFSIYSMPRHDMKWCGSYNGQRVVLFDDVRSDTIMSLDLFLRIADGYPVEFECKNGWRWSLVEKIYLTSNQDMELWWPKATPEDRAAVARRITSHRNSYYTEPLADESPQRAAA